MTYFEELQLNDINQATMRRDSGSGGTSSVPRSERLCKVLPKVMDTAIKGVRDLDEQASSRYRSAVDTIDAWCNLIGSIYKLGWSYTVIGQNNQRKTIIRTVIILSIYSLDLPIK